MSNEEIIKTINRLSFENLIWIAFIIISIIDIYGDELIKKSLINNDKNLDKKAKKLFLGILIFSLLIYYYFLCRNYNDYKKHNNKAYKTRFIGSILVFIGTICFLYYQLSINNADESLSEI